jgi:hypothetical protein
VRRALFVLEGVQNNQSLEALLGYQFERALHDITTANTSNNLNQYILSIREKFPILSNSIPQQGNAAQEVVSPFSVVNGLKLIKATEAQLRAIVTNSAHAALVIKEQNRLEDTLDALSDLMISEAAFQATQGKTDRTAAILNSLKNADVPPELEVNKTPRSTHLSITNRVALHFDPSTANAIVPGWSSEISPRSSTEPGVNKWLGEVFGDPDKIVCSVSNLDANGNESPETVVKLSELNMQPIDVVYSAGEDIQSGAKELEYYIGKVYKGKVNIPVGNRINIKFEPENMVATRHSLASVLPLIRNLRLLLTTSRPANGKDYRPHSKKGINNPQLLFGYDGPELRTRVKDAWTMLKTEVDKVNSKVPNGQQPKSKENPPSFQALFAFYKELGNSREYLQNISLTEGAVAVLLSFLEVVGKYGVKVSFPEYFDGNNPEKVTDLMVVVASVVQMVNKKIALGAEKLEAAEGQEADKMVNRLVECGKAVLGDDFTVIPKFKYTNPSDIINNLTDSTTKQLLSFITKKEDTDAVLAMETWISSVARVRPHMARLEQLRMISEAQGGTELNFRPAQMPFREKDLWLAVEFPEIDERTEKAFDIKDDTICLLVQGTAAADSAALQSALIVDDWTEFIPNINEVTGVAFNYDQPNATSPNTLLLAIEPTGSDNWDWDVLMGIMEDTLRRAKSRAVEPAQLLEDVVFDTLSPMTVANFDLYKSGVSLDYLITSDEFFNQVQNKNFELYKDFDI